MLKKGFQFFQFMNEKLIVRPECMAIAIPAGGGGGGGGGGGAEAARIFEE